VVSGKQKENRSQRHVLEMQELKILRQEELEDKVSIIVGTRPGIIKFSPIIRELEKRGKGFFIVHTGQHYSYNMDKVFFEALKLPEPKYRLTEVADEKFHGSQTARMLAGLEKVLLEEKPKIVLVCGDANTNLAGALAARKLHINVGHVEAGLRSGDWRMPEEHNRVMIDHISDFLFAPTEEAKQNLLNDNVKGQIYVTGNTIVDAVLQNVFLARKKSRILTELALEPKSYFLLTLHREESVDFNENLESISQGIKLVAESFGHQIVFPAHPRTVKRLKDFKLASFISSIKKLNIIEPLSYLDFLMLLSESRLVLTDSGGIQEESCVLKVPCVTLRENTERPETIKVGANYVAGIKPGSILTGVKTMLKKKGEWENPLGENASQKIVDIIEDNL